MPDSLKVIMQIRKWCMWPQNLGWILCNLCNFLPISCAICAISCAICAISMQQTIYHLF